MKFRDSKKQVDEESNFWLQASQTSVDAVWDNSEDDVYLQLLKHRKMVEGTENQT